MLTPTSSLVLKVRRNEPELVSPARPTPNELKPLADLDCVPLLRCNMSLILVYAAAPDRIEKDPAKVIKAALAEALVYYYPWAGRIRERPDGRLIVDCTAEGVVFVEADADARLDQFEEGSLLPPFPCADQLLYNWVSNMFSVVGCPMFTIQVTRFLCRGFIIGINFSHVMSDAIGVGQFLNTIAELARGVSSPSILPVWGRELLNARVSCTLPVPDRPSYVPQVIPKKGDLVSRTFIFNDGEVAALRDCVPQHLQPCTTFELICACIWRCRTIALQYPPEEQVRLQFAVNIRDKFNPPIPIGYYGNATTFSTCVSTAGAICNSSFGDTVELLKKAKAAVTEEYTKSRIDHMVSGGTSISNNVYNMSDVSIPSKINGVLNLDFGWGEHLFAGPPDNAFLPQCFSFIVGYRNGKGKGKAVSVTLSNDAMDRFVNAFHSLLKMDIAL